MDIYTDFKFSKELSKCDLNNPNVITNKKSMSSGSEIQTLCRIRL